jgi:hypothetical protein
VIVAFDFFTAPTLPFKVLYCFFVIEPGRRKIPRFNVTRHPIAEWVVQQLREAVPEAAPYRCVILDRDSKFDTGGKGPAKPAAGRTEAIAELGPDFKRAVGWPPSSVFLARSGVEPYRNDSSVRGGPGRSHRRRASDRGVRRGRWPQATSWSRWPNSVRAVSVGARGDPGPPSARTVPAESRCSRARCCVTPHRAADLVLATNT